MRPEATSRWRLDWLLLFALAVGLRIVAGVVLDGFHHPALNEYEDIARSMVAGKGYRFYHLGVWYNSFAAPLFGWICAGIYLLGGTVATVVAFQIVVNSAHAVLIAAMGERLFGSRFAGLAAGVLMAVHPGLIVYSSAKAHDLTFDSFFFTLVLWLFWRLKDQPTLTRAIIAGCAVGLGAHSRGTTVVFLPIAAVWLLWSSPMSQWRGLIGRIVVAGLCAIAVITPWATRNILINHAFVWMLTTDGESLWDGNNPNATGHSYSTPDRIVLDMLPPDQYKEMRAQPNEVAQSRWFTDHAIQFMKEHPGQALRLFAIKFYAFWWFSPQSGTLYARNWLEIYKAFYAGVLTLAALGLRRILVRGEAETRWRLVLLGLFLLGLSALQSLYYVEGRHRWAIEPLVLIVAGGGAAWLIERLMRRRVAL